MKYLELFVLKAYILNVFIVFRAFVMIKIIFSSLSLSLFLLSGLSHASQGLEAKKEFATKAYRAITAENQDFVSEVVSNVMSGDWSISQAEEMLGISNASNAKPIPQKPLSPNSKATKLDPNVEKFTIHAQHQINDFNTEEIFSLIQRVQSGLSIEEGYKQLQEMSARKKAVRPAAASPRPLQLKPFKPKVNPETLQKFLGVKKQYDVLLSTVGDLDVHQFNIGGNVKFVPSTRDAVLACNRQLKLNTGYSLEHVQEQLVQAGCAKTFPFLIKSFATLNAHFQKSAVDQETGLNVKTLLSQAWDLCQKVQNLRTHNFAVIPDNGVIPTGIASQMMTVGNQQVKVMKLTPVQYFAFRVEENVTTKGTCYPGHAGRLYAMNIELLAALLGEK